MPEGPRDAATLRYHDLGPLQVDREGQPVPLAGRRLTAALSLLIMNVNQRVSTDALVEALWGDSPPAGPEATLQSHLFRLRKVLEPERSRSRPFSTILHEAGGYRLVASPTHIDSLIFDEAAGSARDLLLAGQPRRALNRCVEALALWRGRPWTPHGDEGWARAATTRMEELHVQLRERQIEALLELGDAHQALADLDLLVAEHPLRERFWAQLMLACYRLGRTDEALAAYQRARTLLDEEIGVEPGADLRQLQASILAADPALLGPRLPPAAGATPAAPPTTPEVQLPQRRSPMIGRDEELADLSAVLRTDQLVTVVGPAGVGKNRLIVEAARASVDHFPDGVWFVDLAAAQDGSRLIEVVASTIGLDLGESGTAITALQSFTRSRQLLLVLGNGSHLAGPLAELTDELTSDDEAELSIAVTSREPLGVWGERVWNLGPLPLPSLPTDGDPVDLAALAEQPAVALFRQRAVAAGGSVDLVELDKVAQICVAVDGLPLAIELAAAQTRSFSLTEIADQVRADASALSRIGRGRTGPLTLADSIEQSVATLPSVDQGVHRAVAVLPGPFTAAAAAAVADLPVTGVRNALSGLVHRSLLVPLGPRTTGAASRFSQLAPIRSHGRSTAASADGNAAERRRDAWVTALAADKPRMGDVTAEAAWYQRLDDDLAAVRGTLQHCLVDEPSADGAYVALRLGLYWYYRGMVVEWERWSRCAAGSPAARPFDRLLSGLSLACAMALAGRSDLAPPYVDAVDAYVEPLDDRQLIMLGEYLFGLSNTARATRDVQLGERVATWIRRLAAQTGDAILDLFAEIAELATQVSDGDPDALLPRIDVAHRRALELGNDYAGWSVATLGAVVCLRTQDAGTGLLWSDRTLRPYVDLGIGEAAGPLTLRGGLLASAGEFYEATKTLAAARTQARRGGQRWPRTMSTWTLVAAAEGHLTPAERDRAYEEGAQLDLADLLS